MKKIDLFGFVQLKVETFRSYRLELGFDLFGVSHNNIHRCAGEKLEMPLEMLNFSIMYNNTIHACIQIKYYHV